MLDGDVLAIDELDDDPVAEDRFLVGHWHTFFVPALSAPRLVRDRPVTQGNAPAAPGGERAAGAGRHGREKPSVYSPEPP
ncbi:hypothetical protein GCM10010182_37580 [Actinomadura cremea]|nr:hypothetical protein GCM10010182_37580 [Actinomadura cremea]